MPRRVNRRRGKQNWLGWISKWFTDALWSDNTSSDIITVHSRVSPTTRAERISISISSIKGWSARCSTSDNIGHCHRRASLAYSARFLILSPSLHSSSAFQFHPFCRRFKPLHKLTTNGPCNYLSLLFGCDINPRSRTAVFCRACLRISMWHMWACEWDFYNEDNPIN